MRLSAMTTSLTTVLSENFNSSESLRDRSEEHTSELQSQSNLVCRLLLEKKKYRRHGASRPRARTRPMNQRAAASRYLPPRPTRRVSNDPARCRLAHRYGASDKPGDRRNT